MRNFNNLNELIIDIADIINNIDDATDNKLCEAIERSSNCSNLRALMQSDVLDARGMYSQLKQDLEAMNSFNIMPESGNLATLLALPGSLEDINELTNAQTGYDTIGRSLYRMEIRGLLAITFMWHEQLERAMALYTQVMDPGAMHSIPESYDEFYENLSQASSPSLEPAEEVISDIINAMNNNPWPEQISDTGFANTDDAEIYGNSFLESVEQKELSNIIDNDNIMEEANVQPDFSDASERIDHPVLAQPEEIHDDPSDSDTELESLPSDTEDEQRSVADVSSEGMAKDIFSKYSMLTVEGNLLPPSEVSPINLSRAVAALERLQPGHGMERMFEGYCRNFNSKQWRSPDLINNMKRAFLLNAMHNKTTGETKTTVQEIMDDFVRSFRGDIDTMVERYKSVSSSSSYHVKNGTFWEIFKKFEESFGIISCRTIGASSVTAIGQLHAEEFEQFGANFLLRMWLWGIDGGEKNILAVKNPELHRQLTVLLGTTDNGLGFSRQSIEMICSKGGFLECVRAMASEVHELSRTMQTTQFSAVEIARILRASQPHNIKEAIKVLGRQRETIIKINRHGISNDVLSKILFGAGAGCKPVMDTLLGSIRKIDSLSSLGFTKDKLHYLLRGRDAEGILLAFRVIKNNSKNIRQMQQLGFHNNLIMRIIGSSPVVAERLMRRIIENSDKVRTLIESGFDVNRIARFIAIAGNNSSGLLNTIIEHSSAIEILSKLWGSRESVLSILVRKPSIAAQLIDAMTDQQHGVNKLLEAGIDRTSIILLTRRLGGNSGSAFAMLLLNRTAIMRLNQDVGLSCAMVTRITSNRAAEVLSALDFILHNVDAFIALKSIGFSGTDMLALLNNTGIQAKEIIATIVKREAEIKALLIEHEIKNQDLALILRGRSAPLMGSMLDFMHENGQIFTEVKRIGFGWSDIRNFFDSEDWHASLALLSSNATSIRELRALGFSQKLLNFLANRGGNSLDASVSLVRLAANKAKISELMSNLGFSADNVINLLRNKTGDIDHSLGILQTQTSNINRLRRAGFSIPAITSYLSALSTSNIKPCLAIIISHINLIRAIATRGIMMDHTLAILSNAGAYTDGALSAMHDGISIFTSLLDIGLSSKDIQLIMDFPGRDLPTMPAFLAQNMDNIKKLTYDLHLSAVEINLLLRAEKSGGNSLMDFLIARQERMGELLALKPLVSRARLIYILKVQPPSAREALLNFLIVDPELRRTLTSGKHRDMAQARKNVEEYLYLHLTNASVGKGGDGEYAIKDVDTMIAEMKSAGLNDMAIDKIAGAKKRYFRDLNIQILHRNLHVIQEMQSMGFTSREIGNILANNHRSLQGTLIKLQGCLPDIRAMISSGFCSTAQLTKLMHRSGGFIDSTVHAVEQNMQRIDGWAVNPMEGLDKDRLFIILDRFSIYNKVEVLALLLRDPSVRGKVAFGSLAKAIETVREKINEASIVEGEEQATEERNPEIDAREYSEEEKIDWLKRELSLDDAQTKRIFGSKLAGLSDLFEKRQLLQRMVTLKFTPENLTKILEGSGTQMATVIQQLEANMPNIESLLRSNYGLQPQDIANLLNRAGTSINTLIEMLQAKGPEIQIMGPIARRFKRISSVALACGLIQGMRVKDRTRAWELILHDEEIKNAFLELNGQQDISAKIKAKLYPATIRTQDNPGLENDGPLSIEQIKEYLVDTMRFQESQLKAITGQNYQHLASLYRRRAVLIRLIDMGFTQAQISAILTRSMDKIDLTLDAIESNLANISELIQHDILPKDFTNLLYRAGTAIPAIIEMIKGNLHEIPALKNKGVNVHAALAVLRDIAASQRPKAWQIILSDPELQDMIAQTGRTNNLRKEIVGYMRKKLTNGANAAESLASEQSRASHSDADASEESPPRSKKSKKSHPACSSARSKRSAGSNVLCLGEEETKPEVSTLEAEELLSMVANAKKNDRNDAISDKPGLAKDIAKLGDFANEAFMVGNTLADLASGNTDNALLNVGMLAVPKILDNFILNFAKYSDFFSGANVLRGTRAIAMRTPSVATVYDLVRQTKTFLAGSDSAMSIAVDGIMISTDIADLLGIVIVGEGIGPISWLTLLPLITAQIGEGARAVAMLDEEMALTGGQMVLETLRIAFGFGISEAEQEKIDRMRSNQALRSAFTDFVVTNNIRPTSVGTAIFSLGGNAVKRTRLYDGSTWIRLTGHPSNLVAIKTCNTVSGPETYRNTETDDFIYLTAEKLRPDLYNQAKYDSIPNNSNSKKLVVNARTTLDVVPTSEASLITSSRVVQISPFDEQNTDCNALTGKTASATEEHISPLPLDAARLRALRAQVRTDPNMMTVSHNVMVISNPEAKPDAAILVSLGGGADYFNSTIDRAYIFRIGAGKKNIIGSATKADSVAIEESASGLIDLRGGENSVQLTDNFYPHQELIIDFMQSKIFTTTGITLLEIAGVRIMLTRPTKKDVIVLAPTIKAITGGPADEFIVGTVNADGMIYPGTNGTVTYSGNGSANIGLSYGTLINGGTITIDYRELAEDRGKTDLLKIDAELSEITNPICSDSNLSISILGAQIIIKNYSPSTTAFLIRSRGIIPLMASIRMFSNSGESAALGLLVEFLEHASSVDSLKRQMQELKHSTLPLLLYGQTLAGTSVSMGSSMRFTTGYSKATEHHIFSSGSRNIYEAKPESIIIVHGAVISDILDISQMAQDRSAVTLHRRSVGQDSFVDICNTSEARLLAQFKLINYQEVIRVSWGYQVERLISDSHAVESCAVTSIAFREIEYGYNPLIISNVGEHTAINAISLNERTALQLTHAISMKWYKQADSLFLALQNRDLSYSGLLLLGGVSYLTELIASDRKFAIMNDHAVLADVTEMGQLIANAGPYSEYAKFIANARVVEYNIKLEQFGSPRTGWQKIIINPTDGKLTIINVADIVSRSTVIAVAENDNHLTLTFYDITRGKRVISPLAQSRFMYALRAARKEVVIASYLQTETIIHLGAGCDINLQSTALISAKLNNATCGLRDAHVIAKRDVTSGAPAQGGGLLNEFAKAIYQFAMPIRHIMSAQRYSHLAIPLTSNDDGLIATDSTVVARPYEADPNILPYPSLSCVNKDASNLAIFDPSLLYRHHYIQETASPYLAVDGTPSLVRTSDGAVSVMSISINHGSFDLSTTPIIGLGQHSIVSYAEADALVADLHNKGLLLVGAEDAKATVANTNIVSHSGTIDVSELPPCNYVSYDETWRAGHAGENQPNAMLPKDSTDQPKSIKVDLLTNSRDLRPCLALKPVPCSADAMNSATSSSQPKCDESKQECFKYEQHHDRLKSTKINCAQTDRSTHCFVPHLYSSNAKQYLDQAWLDFSAQLSCLATWSKWSNDLAALPAMVTSGIVTGTCAEVGALITVDTVKLIITDRIITKVAAKKLTNNLKYLEGNSARQNSRIRERILADTATEVAHYERAINGLVKSMFYSVFASNPTLVAAQVLLSTLMEAGYIKDTPRNKAMLYTLRAWSIFSSMSYNIFTPVAMCLSSGASHVLGGQLYNSVPLRSTLHGACSGGSYKDSQEEKQSSQATEQKEPTIATALNRSPEKDECLDLYYQGTLGKVTSLLAYPMSELEGASACANSYIGRVSDLAKGMLARQ